MVFGRVNNQRMACDMSVSSLLAEAQFLAQHVRNLDTVDELSLTKVTRQLQELIAQLKRRQ